MREILFRGKQEEYPGEWIEGMFTIGKFAGKEYHAIERRERRIITYDYEWTMQPYKVIPDTIGQYTGVTDRNGKRIFEGDIVVVYARGYHTVCTVSWAETVAHFQLWQINTVPGTPTALNLGNYDCEVIGNIIDNPELLEVKR